MTMSLPPVWDHTLWDSYNPQLYSFTKYNQEFLRQYTEFLDRRFKLEDKYAKGLRKLCKEFQPKEYSHDKKEKTKFTLQTSFEAMLKELEAQANQHDMLGENLATSSKSLKDSLRKMQLQFQQTEKKVQSLIKELEKARGQLEASRTQYQKSYADLRKARDDFNVNRDNRDITRNEVERFKQVFEQRQNTFEERKISFAKELSDFNLAQRKYYAEQLPEQLLLLQRMQEGLADTCRQNYQLWSDGEIESLKMQSKCAADMRDRIALLNIEADVREFLRRTASGNEVPCDLPFENLGSTESIASQSSQQQAPSRKDGKKTDTIRGTKTIGPAQQKRRLEDYLRAQDQELEKTRKEVDAMQKLILTYQQNPKQAAVVQQQIQQGSDKLAKLTQERAETARELELLGGTAPAPVAIGASIGSAQQSAASAAPPTVVVPAAHSVSG